MTNLQSLLNRLAAASGPDRELDNELCAALGVIEVDIPKFDEGWTYEIRYGNGRVELVIHKGGGQSQVMFGRYAKPITASLDAALALVERKAPTFTVDLTLYRTNGGKFKPKALAKLFCPYGEIREYRGDASTAPLALLIALCRALIAEQA